MPTNRNRPIAPGQLAAQALGEQEQERLGRWQQAYQQTQPAQFQTIELAGPEQPAEPYQPVVQPPADRPLQFQDIGLGEIAQVYDPRPSPESLQEFGLGLGEGIPGARGWRGGLVEGALRRFGEWDTDATIQDQWGREAPQPLAVAADALLPMASLQTGARVAADLVRDYRDEPITAERAMGNVVGEITGEIASTVGLSKILSTVGRLATGPQQAARLIQRARPDATAESVARTASAIHDRAAGAAGVTGAFGSIGAARETGHQIAEHGQVEDPEAVAKEGLRGAAAGLGFQAAYYTAPSIARHLLRRRGVRAEFGTDPTLFGARLATDAAMSAGAAAATADPERRWEAAAVGALTTPFLGYYRRPDPSLLPALRTRVPLGPEQRIEPRAGAIDVEARVRSSAPRPGSPAGGRYQGPAMADQHGGPSSPGYGPTTGEWLAGLAPTKANLGRVARRLREIDRLRGQRVQRANTEDKVSVFMAGALPEMDALAKELGVDPGDVDLSSTLDTLPESMQASRYFRGEVDRMFSSLGTALKPIEQLPMDAPDTAYTDGESYRQAILDTARARLMSQTEEHGDGSLRKIVRSPLDDRVRERIVDKKTGEPLAKVGIRSMRDMLSKPASEYEASYRGITRTLDQWLEQGRKSASGQEILDLLQQTDIPIYQRQTMEVPLVSAIHQGELYGTYQSFDIVSRGKEGEPIELYAGNRAAEHILSTDRFQLLVRSDLGQRMEDDRLEIADRAGLINHSRAIVGDLEGHTPEQLLAMASPGVGREASTTILGTPTPMADVGLAPETPHFSVAGQHPAIHVRSVTLQDFDSGKATHVPFEIQPNDPARGAPPDMAPGIGFADDPPRQPGRTRFKTADEAGWDKNILPEHIRDDEGIHRQISKELSRVYRDEHLPPGREHQPPERITSDIEVFYGVSREDAWQLVRSAERGEFDLFEPPDPGKPTKRLPFADEKSLQMGVAASIREGIEAGKQQQWIPSSGMLAHVFQDLSPTLYSIGQEYYQMSPSARRDPDKLAEFADFASKRLQGNIKAKIQDHNLFPTYDKVNSATKKVAKQFGLPITKRSFSPDELADLIIQNKPAPGVRSYADGFTDLATGEHEAPMASNFLNEQTDLARSILATTFRHVADEVPGILGSDKYGVPARFEVNEIDTSPKQLVSKSPQMPIQAAYTQDLLDPETYLELSRSIKKSVENFYSGIKQHTSLSRMFPAETARAIKNQGWIGEREAQEVTDLFRSLKDQNLSIFDVKNGFILAERDHVPEGTSRKVRIARDAFRDYFDRKLEGLKQAGVLKKGFAERANDDLDREITNAEKAGDTELVEHLRGIKQQLVDLEYIPAPHMYLLIGSALETGSLRDREVAKQWSRRFASYKNRYKRKTGYVSDLLQAREIDVSDLDVGGIMTWYAGRYTNDIHLSRVFNAAKKDGYVIPQRKDERQPPEGYSRPPEEMKIFKGHWVDNALLRELGAQFRSSRFPTLKRWVNWAKTNQFVLQPYYLAMLDVEQHLRLFPGTFIDMAKGLTYPKTSAKELKDIWDDYWQGGERYIQAGEAGTFSKNYHYPYQDQARMMEAMFDSPYEKLWRAGTSVVTGRVLTRDIQRQAFNLAWSGDEFVRFVTFCRLQKEFINKGMTLDEANKAAGQTAAESHGDYADLPAETKGVLSWIGFTPNFQLAMIKHQLTMLNLSRRLLTSYMRDARNHITGDGKNKPIPPYDQEGHPEPLTNRNKDRHGKLPDDEKARQVARENDTVFDDWIKQRQLRAAAMRLGVKSVVGTLAVMLAGQITANWYGYKTDRVHRRWTKETYDKDGQRVEHTVSVALPSNVAIRAVDRLYMAHEREGTYFGNLPQALEMYGHPATVGMTSRILMNNERLDGEPIYHDRDDPLVKIAKSVEYGIYEAIPHIAHILRQQELIDMEPQEAREQLKKELGLITGALLDPITFSYFRRTPDQVLEDRKNRLKNELVEMYLDPDTRPEHLDSAMEELHEVLLEAARFREEVKMDTLLEYLDLPEEQRREFEGRPADVEEDFDLLAPDRLERIAPLEDLPTTPEALEEDFDPLAPETLQRPTTEPTIEPPTEDFDPLMPETLSPVR